MKGKIICVGKLREKYLQQGVAEYMKRLRHYGQWDVVEVKDEPFREPLSEKEALQVMAAEAERIQKEIPGRSYVTALDRGGVAVSSQEWAAHLQQRMIAGDHQFVYIIGGPLGLHPDILRDSHWVLSFSALTYPHTVMRLLLAEQVYRVATILNGEKYHK